ncbi:MAG: fatty acid--CoA ligase family protein [Ilumatobacteraceae bacterium]
MRRLVALDLPGGPDFVTALRRAWDDGDAVLPVDQRFPAATRAALIAAMGASRVVDASGSADLAEGVPVDDGDALVVATSGSTGTPKGVVLTHDAVAASAAATSARLEVDPDRDRWLACLPLAHVGGLSVVTRALHAGTPLTVRPAFDADEVDASDATLVSLVATAMRRIDTSRWRVIVLGGAHAPADRPPNSVTTYGMTETGSGVVYDGVPLDGVEVRIVDGEIHLRAPMLLRCYRDGTDPFLPGGWFPTGDLGELADDGRLTVHGRRGDLIISGGENVWPDPIERLLGTLPSIADVGIAGVPDPEWGHAVTAFVVPTDPARPPTLGELRDAVRAALPAYCAPRNVVIVPQLPRTTLGKLKRAELTAHGR